MRPPHLSHEHHHQHPCTPFCLVVVSAVLLLLPPYSPVLAFTPLATSLSRTAATATGRIRKDGVGMVRNIDFPEALIFYDTANNEGSTSILLEEDGVTLKSGLLELLQECCDVGTPALLIAPTRDTETGMRTPAEVKDFLQIYHQATTTTPAQALWDSIHTITIQPEGFGGSSGFGRKMADPERSPLPKHVVVFCGDLNVCKAARAVGMRVLCLQDNDFADAIIDDYSNIYLEDVATPGSFWLNPPYPRDDEGNKVDVYSLLTMEDMDDDEVEGKGKGAVRKKEDSLPNIDEQEEEEDLSMDALQAILNDMDPL